MNDHASFASFEAKALGNAPTRVALARARRTGIALEALAALDEVTLWEALESADDLAEGTDALTGGATQLDLINELAHRLLGPTCRLCWRLCSVDRRAGEVGACGLGAGLRPYQDFVHLGEELELIPTHAVYLAGCNYRCVYCSDLTHVEEPEQHPEVVAAKLARSIVARRRAGATSLSFVGGLPDVNLPGIVDALARIDVDVPLVWNTNLSASPEAQRLLSRLVDAYVADVKYGSEACSRAGSRVEGALDVTQRLLQEVLPQAYVIVRHLVLPGHVECCALPVLEWLHQVAPGVRLNVMGQFQAPRSLQGSAWDRRPSAAELQAVRTRAEQLGFDLSGPGRIQGLQATGPSASEAAAAAGFSSEITIDAAGDVVIENLSTELLGIVEALGGEVEGELRERRAAGAAFRPLPLAPRDPPR